MNKAIDNLREFLKTTHPFDRYPPEFRESIEMRIDAMTTQEEAALVLGIAGTETNTLPLEIQTLVHRYFKLRSIDSLLTASGLTMPSTTSRLH